MHASTARALALATGCSAEVEGRLECTDPAPSSAASPRKGMSASCATDCTTRSLTDCAPAKRAKGG